MSSDLMDSLADDERPVRRRRVSGFTVVGVLFLVVGLVAVGVYAYQYFGSNLVADRAYQQEKSTLKQQWQADPAPAGAAQPAPAAEQQRVPGQAMGLMRIPKFGADYEVPILTGTETGTLAKGIGWYDSSVRPGQLGNFAVAGHRVTNGEPFRRLLELQKGDQVIVETRDAIYTYVLDTSPADLTVQDDDTWVLDPVPGKPGEQPTQPLITLTTCQDLFHSVDRSIGFGHLQSTQNK
ncbi:class E sortase [Enemella evansiae]|nr:class E sortase [Enemella evansiae]